MTPSKVSPSFFVDLTGSGPSDGPQVFRSHQQERTGSGPTDGPQVFRSHQQDLTGSGPLDGPQIAGTQEPNSETKEISLVIDSIKQRVDADRSVYIMKKMEENRQKLGEVTKNLQKLSIERKSLNSDAGKSEDMLTKRQNEVIEQPNSINISNADNSGSSSHEDGNSSSAILLGSSIAVKTPLPPIKLPEVRRIPPYVTWVFSDRNQKMTEDQSVMGRRRIYYDQNSGEALIASDSDEEVIEEEEKKEFAESEDNILRITIEECGLSDAVLDVLAQRLSRNSDELKARYEVLKKKENDVGGSTSQNSDANPNLMLDKDLDAALDSYDKLFCRRCLVFDCRLHGCLQELIFPAEKPLPWNCPSEENEPCGPHCYHLVLMSENNPLTSPMELHNEMSVAPTTESELVDKCATRQRNSKRAAENVPLTMKKRQKKGQKKGAASDSDSLASGSLGSRDKNARKSGGKSPFQSGDKSIDAEIPNNNSKEIGGFKCWKPLEKSLFEKGVEIFGRNSCLIARNLMIGMKTCAEVFYAMNEDNMLSSQGGDDKTSLIDGSCKVDGNEVMGSEVRRRSRILRRRGKVRRVKYSGKSSGYHSMRKRISDKKEEPYIQYNPCDCKSACGKECSCVVKGTCCEKFCGCPRTCKNRFRGCHCAKSQCRSKQCPCYAARRECDPDVCRNCWINCGDGTIDGPPPKGDNNECRNMKLRLRQQQTVLLGRSDVCGWGAFLKNSVAKDEYLGEYTGELITDLEAEKRGKIYDLNNSSYLFNLNDEYVLDAYRMGDKLKFANHSPNPNCFAKVIMVNGDHRVGIFSKEKINEGEEIFYDYGFTPETAPKWVKKLEASSSKKHDAAAGPSSGRRAKKRA